jgi:hypothetical protein
MTGAVSVGLLQACDDVQLFRRGLDPHGLWPRQRALLGPVESGPRLHVWALGRRSSKTTSAALVGLWDCLLGLDRMVRPGERRHAVAIATNLRQARLFVRAALSIVDRSPLLAELVEAVSEDELLFANGTALSAFPCSSRGARGWPISSLLFDEFAHFLSETEGSPPWTRADSVDRVRERRAGSPRRRVPSCGQGASRAGRRRHLASRSARAMGPARGAARGLL